MKIIITGEFPGLNQFIDANRISRGRWNKGNSMKQRDMRRIETELSHKKVKTPVRIHYCYYCSSRKRDLDNISGYFHKVFQDALVRAGMIPNDGWTYISGFTDDFYIDRKNPRIEVEIEEYGRSGK